MKRSRPQRNRVILGLIALMLISVNAWADNSHATCNNATFAGTYVYAYYGSSGTGSALTRFAVAGLAVFNGDGTSHGVWTTATEEQPVAHRVTFQGTYHVNSDCSATEIDTDQNGNVFHYDDFSGPDGREIGFIQTDPGVVSSGTEFRRQKVPHR